MVKEEILKIITKKLIEVYNPLSIYLFGSYAWGNPSDSSDFDICIIIKDSDIEQFKRSIPAYRALKGMKISKDIIVYTSGEFHNGTAEPSSLCSLIKSQGIKLYEAA